MNFQYEKFYRQLVSECSTSNEFRLVIARAIESFVKLTELLESDAELKFNEVQFLTRDVILIPMKELFLNLFEPIDANGEMEDFLISLKYKLTPFIEMEKLDETPAVISINEVDLSSRFIRVNRSALYEGFISVVGLLHNEQLIANFYSKFEDGR
jgi:hypothetical protein